MVKVVCIFAILGLLAMEKIFVLTKAGLKNHTVGIRVPIVQLHLQQEKLGMQHLMDIIKWQLKIPILGLTGPQVLFRVMKDGSCMPLN